jgi:hypothetical protein
MCPMYNEPDAVITKDDKGVNDGTCKVGQGIFEWIYVLRCDGERGIDSLAT